MRNPAAVYLLVVLLAALAACGTPAADHSDTWHEGKRSWSKW